MEVIKELTINDGGTLRTRMKANCNKLTRTPENSAVIQRLTGKKYSSISSATAATMRGRKG